MHIAESSPPLLLAYVCFLQPRKGQILPGLVFFFCYLKCSFCWSPCYHGAHSCCSLPVLETTIALYLNCPGNFQPNRNISATEGCQNCHVLVKAEKTPDWAGLSCLQWKMGGVSTLEHTQTLLSTSVPKLAAVPKAPDGLCELKM